ncbi:MAG: CNP1-like family protein [Zoogloeaceae bacterium]|jgi:hypothetical protein|nr:CNP1-like family protein [Zoogloeaceae bacterium]
MKTNRSHSWRVLLAGAALCSFSVQAGFLGGLVEEEDYDEEKPEWKENEVTLPPAPQNDNLISLYVSPTAQNRFFVDLASLSVGSDGIVRYTLVIISPSGVRNTSYEGMRCQTSEWRIYASGRPDGAWSQTRGKRWFPVREERANRHHAELYREFFCPGGILNDKLEDIRRALKKEGKPFRTDDAP